jgi:hypothetical protein
MGFDVRPVDPFGVDHRYRLFFFYNDILSWFRNASASLGGAGARRDTTSPDGNATFKDAGILLRAKESCHVLINFKKNGNYAVVKDGVTTYVDNGIILKTSVGIYYSSFVNEDASYAESGDEILVAGKLLPVPSVEWQRKMLIPFKVFNTALGALSAPGMALDKHMKRFLVLNTKGTAVPFRRRLGISAGGVTCVNEVEHEGEVSNAPAVSFCFGPTSNLFYNVEVAR